MAWCLNLCAWGLKLAARSSTLLDAWSLKLVTYGFYGSRRDGARRESLVFGVSYVRNRPVPTGSAAGALVALVRGRACLALSRHSRRPRPEGYGSLINHM